MNTKNSYIEDGVIHIIPKEAQRIVEEIKAQWEYEQWLSDLVDAWKEMPNMGNLHR